MSDTPTLIVVADDPQHISAFIDASQNATDLPFKMECVKTLAEGANRFRPTETRAIFISQPLLDFQHLETLDRLLLSASQVPVLVLASANDCESGLAVQLFVGINSHFSGDHLHCHSLVPTIRKLLEPTSEDRRFFTREAPIQIKLRLIIGTALNPKNPRQSYVGLALRGERGFPRN
jgi:hypothetical protein